MRYFITGIFAVIAAFLSLMTGWSVYNALTESPYWYLVALGILIPTIVSILITSAAWSAARDY